jgi:hypothetical protein
MDLWTTMQSMKLLNETEFKTGTGVCELLHTM